MKKRVTIYSTAICPICDKAKSLLSKWKIAYDEIRIDEDHSGLREMAKITNGARTVPQITIDGNWVGGFSELTELHMDGALDYLMVSQ
jgi:glutaredoxin 3